MAIQGASLSGSAETVTVLLENRAAVSHQGFHEGLNRCSTTFRD